MQIPDKIKNMLNLTPFKPFLTPLKWVVIVLVVFFGGLKIKSVILNSFVTKGEYAETLKTLKKDQQRIDSLYVEVTKRDSVIAELKNKRIAIENSRIKNKNLLKKARGNIAALDSLANTIL
jgi:septal ring factor EnvC (AmiA/AmiB activator)